MLDLYFEIPTLRTATSPCLFPSWKLAGLDACLHSAPGPEQLLPR